MANGSIWSKPDQSRRCDLCPGVARLQDPPRAAVPPARGGIGPDKRPAWADPGEAFDFTLPGLMAPTALNTSRAARTMRRRGGI